MVRISHWESNLGTKHDFFQTRPLIREYAYVIRNTNTIPYHCFVSTDVLSSNKTELNDTQAQQFTCTFWERFRTNPSRASSTFAPWYGLHRPPHRAMIVLAVFTTTYIILRPVFVVILYIVTTAITSLTVLHYWYLVLKTFKNGWRSLPSWQ